MTFASLLALALITGVHLLVHRLRFLSNSPRSRTLSFAGGVSLGYVFLNLLPEIAHGQSVLATRLERSFALDELAIYVMALAGLLGFYALERSLDRASDMGRRRDGSAKTAEGGAESHALFWLHLAMFGVYSMIIGSLLVDRPDGPAFEDDGATVQLGVFTVAMALHFLVVDFGLRMDFPRGWLRFGRWVMAGATMLGWALGTWVRLDELWLLSITALLGGAVILNVLKEEIPREREARLFWLLAGAGTFAALVALG